MEIDDWRLTIAWCPSITRSCLTKCGMGKDRRQQPAERAKEYNPGRQGLSVWSFVTASDVTSPLVGDEERGCATHKGRRYRLNRQPRQPWFTRPLMTKPRRGDGRCFRARFFHRPRWGLASPRGLAQGSLRFALGFIPAPPPEANTRSHGRPPPRGGHCPPTGWATRLTSPSLCGLGALCGEYCSMRFS